MLQKFISKPVLSTVISIIIVILGLLGLFTLPISQYPDIAPPTVEVTASYQGANADVVRNSVLIPLEEQINGVENMQYMTSTAGNDGSATITLSQSSCRRASLTIAFFSIQTFCDYLLLLRLKNTFLLFVFDEKKYHLNSVLFHH